MKAMKKAEVVSAAPRTVLGDSPLWCAVTNSLVYVDILMKTVHNFNPASGNTESMIFNEFVGFAIPSTSSTPGKLIVVVGLETKIVEADISRQQILRTLVEVPSKFCSAKGMRFNDAKCSPSGDLFAGYISRHWRDGSRGFLLKYVQGLGPKLHGAPGETDITAILKDVLPMDEGIHMPNGMAWHGDEFMYIVDTGAGEISRLEFEVPEGGGAPLRLIDRRCVFKLPEAAVSSGYVLDGMTIDSKGKIWVALTGAGCILRIDPATGNEVFRLHLTHKKPTSCTFGELCSYSTCCSFSLY
jgi:gluconolactonase